MLVLLLLTACEKAVDFRLDEKPDKLVVEGVIETNAPPAVILTTSLDYFATLSPEKLFQSFVHDADVWVSTGNLTHKLKEYRRPVDSSRFVYYYSIDSSNLTTAFTGKQDTRYQLRIDWRGTTYRAETSIPVMTRRVDSLWWEPAQNTDPDAVQVIVRATDKPGLGDYIRYATSINGSPFFPATSSVFDDIFIDGTTYEVQVEPGIDRNRTITDRDRFFHRGDTIVFKLSNIDKNTYEFWRTVEHSYQSIGNPFATPVKVTGNISGGALGYFGGYATQYRTLVIPR